jgi:hypothetical protein
MTGRRYSRRTNLYEDFVPSSDDARDVDAALASTQRRTLQDAPDSEIRERLLWATNLMDNYARGTVAEVLVAELLGSDFAA